MRGTRPARLARPAEEGGGKAYLVPDLVGAPPVVVRKPLASLPHHLTQHINPPLSSIYSTGDVSPRGYRYSCSTLYCKIFLDAPGAFHHVCAFHF